MIKQIVLNGRTISYDLERKNVKNLNLRIIRTKVFLFQRIIWSRKPQSKIF